MFKLPEKLVGKERHRLGMNKRSPRKTRQMASKISWRGGVKKGNKTCWQICQPLNVVVNSEKLFGVIKKMESIPCVKQKTRTPRGKRF